MSDAMKKLLFLILSLVYILPAGAQSVNANYDRNALTVIAVHHNDRYDAISDAYLKQYFPGGEKFDNNMVDTRYIQSAYSRFQKTEDNSISSYIRECYGTVENQVKKEDVARQVVAKWFNRTPGGVMDLNLINKRADYNATDQTYNIAAAQALGEYLLHGDGVKLVDNSYILVVDHSVPVRSEGRDSNGNLNDITYTTQAIGYLYKLNFGDLQRQAVYDQWIYAEDPVSTKNAKKAAFDRINFPITLLQTVDATSSGSINPKSRGAEESQALQQAVTGCAAAVIDKLEKQVEAWMVKTTIYKTRPILSKVGTKEGIKNMSRFEVLEYVMDDEGNIDTRRKGYVRATTVAENTRASKGNSATSQFYQIAGTKLEPGMLLKEKKSANMDVKALYYGGATKGFGAEADMMFGMSNGGSCSHVRISATLFPFKEGKQGVYAADGHTYELTGGITAIDVRMGYGYGVRPFRQLEVIPAAYVLADYLTPKTSGGSESEQTFMRKTAWCIEPGVDVNITIFYPVKINAGAFYSLPILKGADWQSYNDDLAHIGQARTGFTWRAGLVYEF